MRPPLTSTASEVDLGLEGEEGQCEGDGCCGAHGHQHRVGRVEGGDGAQHETLAHCKDSETDEVARTLPPDIPTAGEDDDAGEGSSPAGEHDPLVLLDVTFNGLHIHEESHDGARHEELAHQDGVNLPDEAQPDRLLIKAREAVLRFVFRSLAVSLAVVGVGRYGNTVGWGLSWNLSLSIVTRLSTIWLSLSIGLSRNLSLYKVSLLSIGLSIGLP